MITFAALLVLSLGVAAWTRATIRHDGYGSRPAPRSHHPYFSTQRN